MCTLQTKPGSLRNCGAPLLFRQYAPQRTIQTHLILLWALFAARSEKRCKALLHGQCHGHFRIRIFILIYPTSNEYNNLRGPGIPFTARVSFFVVYKETKRFLLLVHTDRRNKHEEMSKRCRVPCTCPDPRPKLASIPR